jgi:hypothetical protein
MTREASNPFDRYSGQARRALMLAYQEAQRFEHDFLGTEHLLSGVLREESPEIVALFKAQNVPLASILSRLDAILEEAEGVSEDGRIFLTPRARHALDRAAVAAQQAHVEPIGAAHLLEALITDDDSEPARVLDDVGVDRRCLRDELKRLSMSPNRDLLVQPSRAEALPPRADPSADQLAHLLLGGLPHADLNADGFAFPEPVPDVAELDWQLLLTQMVLAISLGAMAGFILYHNADGMAGVGSAMFLVALFRNSLLGSLAAGLLGAMIARRLAADNPFLLIVLTTLGVFVGSFLGGFWRRFCPGYVKPSTTHQKPPGVS